MIVRVGCLGIRVRIVVLLAVIRRVVVEVRMTTRRIPMPVPTTKSRNGMTGSLMRSGEANFSSQVIGFGERERIDRMRCEVEKYARVTEVTIKEWIVQMETYFNISRLKPT